MTPPTAEIYTLSGATGEIFIMLLVSFVLGALLGRLLGTNTIIQVAQTMQLPAPKIKKDDLKVIEGIGPRIEELLFEHGIFTWKMLSMTPVDRLERILATANGHMKMHDPKTWPDQASLAAGSKWAELKKFQETLEAGRDH